FLRARCRLWPLPPSIAELGLSSRRGAALLAALSIDGELPAVSAVAPGRGAAPASPVAEPNPGRAALWLDSGRPTSTHAVRASRPYHADNPAAPALPNASTALLATMAGIAGRPAAAPGAPGSCHAPAPPVPCQVTRRRP